MKRLFLDESGECSFSLRSDYRHFLVTILCVDASDVKKIQYRLKRKFADFIRKGWNKTKEPKATLLYKNRKFGPQAISKVLTTLVTIPSLEVSYIVVNKQKISNQSFRNAPYGTAYNYFTGVLLSELIFLDGFDEVHLIYDKRNKETHENKHFREYLQTNIIGTALEKNLNVNFLVEGNDSALCYGLLAVDYFSWAIFRAFEHGDSQFLDLFSHRFKRKREWYI